MRKAIVALGLAILVGANYATLGQVQRFAVDGPKPPTLEALIDHSTDIVEVTIESAYPVIDQSPLITDFLIRVNRVVKGNLTSAQIVVPQFGGTIPGGRTAEPGMYSLMQPGERYILFLTSETRNLANRGVPRYQLAADNYGLAKIESSQVVWSRAMPETWKTTYRFQPDQLIAAIQARPPAR